MIRAAAMTAPDEIGCDDCFDKLHEYAEKKLQGTSPEKAMPLVADHLKRCGECRQEFEALYTALKVLKEHAL